MKMRPVCLFRARLSRCAKITLAACGALALLLLLAAARVAALPSPWNSDMGEGFPTHGKRAAPEIGRRSK